MNITGIVKKSFGMVMDNPSVTLFLVLFLIIINLITPYIFLVHSKLTAYALILCSIALFVCFLAGWFGIIKELAVTDEKKAKEKNFPAIFFENIGKNVIPLLSGIVIYTALFLFITYFTSTLSTKIFGSLDSIASDITNNIQDGAAFLNYVKNLTLEQKYALYASQLSLIFAWGIFNFLLMFYFPAIVFDDGKNILLKSFAALKISLCVLFKNFFSALLIFLMINFINIAFGIIRALFMGNVLIEILLLIGYIYFLSLIIMVIFNYYGEKYNSNNRCDSVGEDNNLDKTGESAE